MERHPPLMKQGRLLQDTRTGSLGVTLPSKRRSDPDLELEEDSESEEASVADYEYICTSLVSASTRHLSEIEVETMSGIDVSAQVHKVLQSGHGSTHASLLIDPKAILRARYPQLLPDSSLTPERIRMLARIGLQIYLHKIPLAASSKMKSLGIINSPGTLSS